MDLPFRNRLIISLLIVPIFLGLIFSPFLFPKIARAATLTATVIVVYATETHQIDTTQTFTETLSNSNETSLDISFPANSLSSGEAVSMVMSSITKGTATLNKPLPSGKLAANTFYDFSFQKVSDSSSVTSFNQNITLIFYYTDADISGTDESTLGVYRWDGSQWSAIGGSTIDASLNKVTVSTAQFSYFGLMGNDLSTAAAPALRAGGGYRLPPSRVSLQGRAYPNAVMTVLKNGAVSLAGLQADSSGNFKIPDFEISPEGIYTFGFRAKDAEGRESVAFNVIATIYAGTNVYISGILAPPTIELAKTSLKKGETLKVLGQAVPESELNISIIDSSGKELTQKGRAKADGTWLLSFDASALEEGSYIIKAKTLTPEGLVSVFSQALNFTLKGILTPGVSEVPEVPEVPEIPIIKKPKTDLNGDSRVDLIDFSILLYHWGIPGNKTADINKDGAVNLIDFSIMMYEWTG